VELSTTLPLSVVFHPITFDNLRELLPCGMFHGKRLSWGERTSSISLGLRLSATPNAERS
jgi:hypothetical protein